MPRCFARALGPPATLIACSSAVSLFLGMDGLKHYFPPRVKHCLTYALPAKNKAMLDAKGLAERIRKAMDERRPPLTSSELAKECKVTPQAVHGWRQNGRIAKRHIPTLAALTNRDTEFFLSDDYAEQSPRKGQKGKIKDRDKFRIMVRAWQEATPTQRETFLNLATALLKLDGTRQRKRSV